jgi:hypothetical protein
MSSSIPTFIFGRWLESNVRVCVYLYERGNWRRLALSDKHHRTSVWLNNSAFYFYWETNLVFFIYRFKVHFNKFLSFSFVRDDDVWMVTSFMNEISNEQCKLISISNVTCDMLIYFIFKRTYQCLVHCTWLH